MAGDDLDVIGRSFKRMSQVINGVDLALKFFLDKANLVPDSFFLLLQIL